MKIDQSVLDDLQRIADSGFVGRLSIYPQSADALLFAVKLASGPAYPKVDIGKRGDAGLTPPAYAKSRTAADMAGLRWDPRLDRATVTRASRVLTVDHDPELGVVDKVIVNGREYRPEPEKVEEPRNAFAHEWGCLTIGGGLKLQNPDEVSIQGRAYCRPWALEAAIRNGWRDTGEVGVPDGLMHIVERYR